MGYTKEIFWLFSNGKTSRIGLTKVTYSYYLLFVAYACLRKGGFALLLVQRKGRSIEVESGGAESTFPDTANLAALMANGLHLYLQQQFRK